MPPQEVPVRLQRRVVGHAEASIQYDESSGVLRQAASHGEDAEIIANGEQTAIEHPMGSA